MPEIDTSPATTATTDTSSDQQTRRGFLVIAGAGAAGATMLGAGTAHNASAPTAVTVPPGIDAPLVAYVPDPHAGKVSIMIGDREVTVQDADLAARIARAAAGR